MKTRNSLLSWVCQILFRDEDLLRWSSKCYGPLFSWLIFLPPFYPLLHLLNSFLCLFYLYSIYHTLLQSLCLICLNFWPFIFIDCLNACNDSPFRQLWCTDYLHAYNNHLKTGMIQFKNKITPSLLPIINYFWNEYLSDFLDHEKFIEWNTIYNLLRRND